MSTEIAGEALSRADPDCCERLGADEYTGFAAGDAPAQSQRRILRLLIEGLRRRWTRARRRRRVGRAYDMALEIARMLPQGADVVDVGCGDGFIAHHLSALLGSDVIGIDVGNDVQARIDYRRYDGRRFPLPDKSVDAVLFCYVLHHVQDAGAVLSEVRRILRNEGVAIIYEDIPQQFPDRVLCRFHSWRWRERTGSCTFRSQTHWRLLFEAHDFEVVQERALARWRNFMHPVRRRFYLLRVRTRAEVIAAGRPRTRLNRLRGVPVLPRWS